MTEELKEQWELDVASGYPNPESLWQWKDTSKDTSNGRWFECAECATTKSSSDAIINYRRCKDADHLISEWKASTSYYQRRFKGNRIDVYRLLDIYGASHPCQQHAIKKLLRAGQSIKPIKQDIEETIGTLKRWLEMIEEDGELCQQ